MKLLGNKLLVIPIKEENSWGYEDKEEVKHGELAFDWKGEVAEEKIELKKGEILYYQYPYNVKLEGVEYNLVSPSNLICLK